MNVKRIKPALFPVFIFVFSLVISGYAFAGQPRTAFINAAVYTMNPKAPHAQAVVIEGNRIIYVGDTKTAKKIVDQNTSVFDLKGKMLLPGFIESHMHPAIGGLLAGVGQLDQRGTKDQYLARVKKAVNERKSEPMITLMGFTPEMFGPDGPTAKDLDVVESEKPVMIIDNDGHSMWVNTAALKMAGVTKDTPDPLPGGHYYKRDRDGNPTGWCIEPMTYAPFIAKMSISPDDINQGNAQFFPFLTSFGITTVFDAASPMEELSFKAYADLEKKNKLTFRVFGCHSIANPALLPTAVDDLSRLKKEYDSRLFKVNVMKVVYDGTLDAKSCAMFEDFANDRGNKGFELMPPQALSNFVRKCDDAGFNIHIHAIGNRAISDVLGAYENLKKAKGLTPTRKTICHVQFFMPDTGERLKALGDVTAQTTPLWMIRDDVTEPAVGKTAYEMQALFNSLDKAGVRVTFGSDFPASTGIKGLNPFNEIEVGHTRRDIGKPDSNFLPPADERLPIDTLLRGYTINGAYQLGVEKDLGSIEVGKLADMIVLEKNLFKQKNSDIHNNQVLLTVMDGNIVYDAMKDKKAHKKSNK